MNFTFLPSSIVLVHSSSGMFLAPGAAPDDSFTPNRCKSSLSAADHVSSRDGNVDVSTLLEFHIIAIFVR